MKAQAKAQSERGRGQRRLTPGQWAVVAFGGLITVGLVAALIFALVSNPEVQQRLGTDEFEVGDAAALADRIQADNGFPLLFADLLGQGRDLYVNHLGDDRWVAFEARAPGAPRRCQLRYRPDTRQLVDPCDRTTYPADGTGLLRYPAEVNAQGKLVVNLRTRATP